MMFKRNVPLLTLGDDAIGSVTERTVTLKFCVALKLGVPLSVTTTENGFVVLACEMSGRQLRIPFVAFSVAPAGAVGRLKLMVCAGLFASVAVFVMTRVCPGLMVRLLAVLVKAGGEFEKIPVLMMAVAMEYGASVRLRSPDRLAPARFSVSVNRCCATPSLAVL